MSRAVGVPRLLPVLIIVATAALVVRVAWIAHDLAALAPAAADIAAERPLALVPLEVASRDADHEESAETAAAEHHEPAPEAGDESTEDAASPPSSGVADNGAGAAEEDAPTTLSPSEITVLQQLADRRKELTARESEIRDREALLEAAESRIDQKVQEFKELLATLEDLVRAYEEQEDEKIRSLVKIYENMKPRDAARIFEELELDTVLLVADRMKERKLAPIMATMNPAKAKDVTVELARRRQLPDTMRLHSAPAE